ncbi:MAG: PAS domain S-box protein [Bacteroidota bacterium]
MSPGFDIPQRHERWLTAGFVAVIILFIALGVTMSSSIIGYLDNSAAVHRSHDLHSDLLDVVASLKDMQRGALGFVVTEDSTFLNPYLLGVQQIALELDTLGTAVPVSQKSARRLEMIEVLSGRILDITKAEVDLVIDGKTEEALEMVRGTEAKRALDAIENVVQQITEEENILATDRQLEAHNDLRESLVGIVAASALFLTIIIIIFVLLKRQLRERNRLAGTLARSEQRLQTVVNSIQEGITFSNTEGRFEIFNPRMREITGYTVDEANRAGDFSKLIYPDAVERQRALDGVKTLIAQRGPHTSETTITDRNGRKKLLRISSQMIGGLDHRMFLSTYQDITEQRTVEEAVRESERRYRLLFQTSPIPIWVYDEETLAILEVNDVSVDHYGYTRDEFLTMTIKDVRPPEDVPDLISHLAAHHELFRRSGVWRHQKKDGTIIRVDVRSHAIDWQGHRARLVMLHDLTERLQVEEELRVQKSYFEQLFEAMPEGVALLDGEGTVRNVNKAYEQIFGVSKEDVIGSKVTSITVPEEYYGEVFDSLDAVMSGVGIHLETRRHRKDGTPLDVSIIATPVDLGGGQRMVYGIYRDITQKKRAEQEREELIEQLQKALAEVKTLSGLLPLCAWCKKVRDDQGYYHQLENYIAAHSDATFTHGICPECLEKFNSESGIREKSHKGNGQSPARPSGPIAR